MRKHLSIELRSIYVTCSLIVLLTLLSTAASVLWRLSFTNTVLPGVIQPGSPGIDAYTVESDPADPLSGILSGPNVRDLAVQFLYDADTREVSDFVFDFGGFVFEGTSRNSINMFSVYTEPTTGNFVFYLNNTLRDNSTLEAYVQFTSPLTNQGGRVDIVPADIPFLTADRGALLNSISTGGTGYVRPAGNIFGIGRELGGPTADQLTTTTREYFLYGVPQSVPVPEPSSLGLLALSLSGVMLRRRRA